MSSTPRITKALVLQKSSPARSPLYHDAVVEEQPIPALKSGEVLVKMSAVVFNHRELWIRKGLYPRIALGSTFGADGKVIAVADAADPLLEQRVFLTPMCGWESDPNGPESNFGILGSSSFPPLGTFAEYVVVRREEVIPTPPHLTDEQIAAWPIAWLTTWRPRCPLADVKAGQNILIPGIGGGVALIALQLCVALGASVYVTSGDARKIDKAIKLGAKGGASYKDDDWPVQIGALLKQNAGGGVRPVLDAVIDGGGDDIMRKTSLYLKSNGRVVCYGMTAGPEISMTMREVMRGQQLLGTMTGSRADLNAATAFLAKHKIVPVAVERGFEMIQSGSHFGKIVVKVGGDGYGERVQANL
ncbi:NAD-P-binding protein [Mycena galericulata]|nr:NAD-P-binding protein [Mycena galericulata]